MRRRGMTAVVIGLVGVMGIYAGPAAAEPNENASCVAKFGAAVREGQAEGENFGEFVRATATQGGIHGGEAARRKCGENPKK
jgi:hypothetical protein